MRWSTTRPALPRSRRTSQSLVKALITQDKSGIYHITNGGACTWFQFAKEIFSILHIDVPCLPVSSAQIQRRARRPAYSVLDCSKLRNGYRPLYEGLARSAQALPRGIMMKCIFFSDTHLAREDHARHVFVTTFIKEICTNADMVFILGDLFEFYHGYDGYIYPWYKNVIDALRDIALRGTAVYHIEGNHEFEMGPFFSSYTGLTCARNLTIEIDGKEDVSLPRR